MPLTNKRILLLDDDDYFRRAMKRALQGEKAGVVSAPTIQIDAVLAALAIAPTDLVLDVSLGDAGDALEFLHKLTRRGADLVTPRIWLISGREFLNLDRWRQAFPNVQATWLRKPVSATQIRDLLGTGTLPQESVAPFRLPDELRHHPLPLRVLDRIGAVVYASHHWSGVPANLPDPKTFLPAFCQGKAPDPVLFTAPQLQYIKLPPTHHQSTGHYFRLHSYATTDGTYLVQVAERLGRLGYIHRLDELIDQTFEIMRSAGFGRGRYYRIELVPGCEGVLQLVRLYGSSLATGMHPLYGNMAQRVNDFYTPRNGQKNDELSYRIRARKEEDRQDTGVRYWERLIPKHNLQSWVEIPVLSCGEGDELRRPVALFIFDRLPGNEEEKEVLQDGSPNEVTEASVKQVAPLLLHVVRDLRAAFALERKESERKTLRQLARLDEDLLVLSEPTELMQALVKTAVQLTEAKSGVLLVKDGGAEILREQASFPPEQVSCLKGIGLPLDQELFPTVRCWKQKQDIFLPDYLHSEERQAILDHAVFSECDNPGELRAWFEQGFASALVLPVGHRNRSFGALCLHGSHAYQFNADQVAAVRALLQRVRWFLEATIGREQQFQWEIALVHEFRSDLAPAKQFIRSALHDECARTEDLQMVLDYLNRLHDLTFYFMRLRMDASQDKEQAVPFPHPGKLVQDALEQAGRIHKDVGAQLSVTTPWVDSVWNLSLGGQKEVFGRVVRCLADNAYKYSEEDDLDGPSNTRIVTVAAKTEGPFWVLTLTNPGKMSDEANKLKFTPFQKPQHRRKSGSHVALASNTKCAQAYGGSIALDNVLVENTPHVRATLRWPLAPRPENGETQHGRP